MKVYGLVGRSGTGKSTKSISLSLAIGIELLIDDGLLINTKQKEILAGISAKKYIQNLDFERAMEIVLFEKQEESFDVQQRILQSKLSSILIIGTSLEMITMIKNNLHLPEFQMVYDIKQISTEQEIEMALHSRINQGRHTIPVQVDNETLSEIEINFKK